MVRLAVTLAALLAGAAAPAHAVSETAEGFSAAMQGCWNRMASPPDGAEASVETGNAAASQMCLEGGVEGAMTLVDCQSHGDLTECATQEGRYAFRDEKFWRGLDGNWDSCDVLLEPHERVTLMNCIGIDAPPGAGLIADAVYERAVGQ